MKYSKRDAKAYSRATMRGIWADEMAVPPWEWREMNVKDNLDAEEK